MSHTEPPMNLEALLAHRPWVRALARTLVFDESRADDLEQQTWLAALSNPPRDAESSRGWLAGVMRRQAARLWRTEGRRMRRERAVARPESIRSAADVVADTERHRAVVDAVLELEEPYRATVLLRYFEGLPPREIAARLDVPVETVRSRQKRAIAQLRGRFDRDHGGDRRAWCTALLPLLGVRPERLGKPLAAGATTTGVIAMTAKLKITLATVAALLLLGVGWWALDDEAGPDAPPRDVDVAANAGAGADDERARSRAQPVPADPGAGTAAEPEPDPTDAPLPTGGGLLVVSGPEDDAPPVVGASLRVVREGVAPIHLASDGRGYAALPANEEGTATVWASAAGRAGRRIASVSMTEGPTRIVLPEGRPVVVRFTRPDGSRLTADDAKAFYEASRTKPRAELVWSEALGGGAPASVLRTMFGDGGEWHTRSGLTWKDGSIELSDRLAPGEWRMIVWTPSGAPYVTAPLDGTEAGVLEVDIPVAERPALVRVRFVDDETGAPLAAADVTPYFEYGDDQAFVPGDPRTTDADGVVFLPLPGPSGRDPFAGYMRGSTWWLVSDSHVGTLSYGGMRRHEDGDEFETRVSRTATLVGHAYGRNGTPAVGARIEQRKKGWATSTIVGEDGLYRLDGVWTGGSKATVFLIEDLAAMKLDQKQIPVTPGEVTEADIGTRIEPGTTASITGRVTVAGRPLEGVLVGVKAEGDSGKGAFGSTDADGRFALEALRPGGTRVRMLFGDLRVDDYGLRSAEPITLAAGDEKELVFDLPAGVIHVRLLDGETEEPVSGALVLARPQAPEVGADHFPGFATRFGWSAPTDRTGTAPLIGLLPGENHTVQVFAQGYERTSVADQAPGTADVPRVVEVRLTKSE